MNPAPLLRALRFAAHEHRKQRRKDVDASPYIKHPIEVAEVLASEGGVTDEVLLSGAVLHDTVEDTGTTLDDLRSQFGDDVAELVREVTDDKSLPKAERKRLQVVHAATASPRARQLKIADKICNLRDITEAPPADWSAARRGDYIAWAAEVVANCRGVNPALDAAFDVARARAEEKLAAGD